MDRRESIVKLAQSIWHEDGAIEIDDTAQVSEGFDNGAYVQAWVWVDFEDTELSKEAVLEEAGLNEGGTK